MKGLNRIQLRSAGVSPNVKNQGKSEVPSQKSARQVLVNKPIRPRPRPHKCSNLARNLLNERPEITEASDLKVKASECRRKTKEDVWEEGGRVCSLQEVALKAPSGVVTVEYFGDAVTPNVDFVEPGVRLYKRNVSKYTYKSQLPVSKTSVGAAKSTASTQILSRPPLLCNCTLNPQPPVADPLKTLPKVIFKDSANFAKFRHDISDDEQRLYSNVSAGTPRKRSELVANPSKTKTRTLVASRNSKISDHQLKRLTSSNSLFSYAEPSKHPSSLGKSRLSRIAESTVSKTSSKASSKHPIIQAIPGRDEVSAKMNEKHVLKRIVYRAEGVLHDEKLKSPRNGTAKSKIHPIGKVRNPRTIRTF